MQSPVSSRYDSSKLYSLQKRGITHQAPARTNAIVITLPKIAEMIMEQHLFLMCAPSVNVA
jgi:hypothetical protein